MADKKKGLKGKGRTRSSANKALRDTSEVGVDDDFASPSAAAGNVRSGEATQSTQKLSKDAIRKRFEDMKARSEKDAGKVQQEEPQSSGKRDTHKRKRRGKQVEKEAEKKTTVKKTRRYNTMLTRTSPLSLFTAIKKLNAEQRDKVTEIGFGSLLKMNLDGLPSGLGYFVVDKFSPEECEIVIGTGRIKITRESIHDMIGAPHGGVRLSNMTSTKEGEVMALRWKRQFTEKSIRPGHVLKLMDNSKVADKYFVRNFIVLFCSTMARVKSNGICDLEFLDKLDDSVPVASIDWCDYIYESLSSCKKKWRGEGADFYFSGPLTTLMLHYVDSVRCEGFFVKRRRPAILGWTFDLLKRREEAEVELGGFGRGDFFPPYEVDENEDENLTVEGSLEKLDIIFRNYEELKESSELILAGTYARFPGCPELRLWEQKVQDFFNDRHENAAEEGLDNNVQDQGNGGGM